MKTLSYENVRTKIQYEVTFRAFDEDCDGTHYDRYEKRVFDSKGDAWLFFETKSVEDDAWIAERTVTDE